MHAVWGRKIEHETFLVSLGWSLPVSVEILFLISLTFGLRLPLLRSTSVVDVGTNTARSVIKFNLKHLWTTLLYWASPSGPCICPGCNSSGKALAQKSFLLLNVLLLGWPWQLFLATLAGLGGFKSLTSCSCTWDLSLVQSLLPQLLHCCFW